jgi:hypothetical protein
MTIYLIKKYLESKVKFKFKELLSFSRENIIAVIYSDICDVNCTGDTMYEIQEYMCKSIILPSKLIKYPKSEIHSTNAMQLKKKTLLIDVHLNLIAFILYAYITIKELVCH